MEHIVTTIRKCMAYPVGDDIQIAMTYAEIQAKAFLAIASFKRKSVFLLCRGSSGAMLAALFSAELKKDKRKVLITHFKKPGERSHSENGKPYIPAKAITVIIDDFMESGNTVNDIYEQNGGRTIDCLILERALRIQATVTDLKFTPRYFIEAVKGKKK